MSAVDLTLLLKDFRSPVVTTSEVAALMRGRVDSANKMLGRLATKGVVKQLARGLWALGRDLEDSEGAFAPPGRALPELRLTPVRAEVPRDDPPRSLRARRTS